MENLLTTMAKRNNFYMTKGELIKWGSLVFIIMSILGFIIASLIIGLKRDALIDEVKNRVEILASGKADVVSTWTNGLKNVGNHITEADIVRLFATELGYLTETGEEENIDQSILAQLPYMQEVMAEFTRQNNLIEAIMVNRKGKPFISSSATPKITPAQQNAIGDVLKTKEPKILSIRSTGGRLMLDILKPVFMLEEEIRSPEAVAVLISVFAIEDILPGIMSSGPLAQKGESLYLIQNVGDKSEYISLGKVPYVKPLNSKDKVEPLAFGMMNSLVEGNDVFMSSANVKGTPFMVVQEYNVSNALAGLESYASLVKSVSLFVVLFLFAVVIALVTFILGARNRQRVHMQQQVMNALVKAVEIRDPYLGGHHNRLAKLVLDVANSMKLDVNERSTLYYSAMLSGIGKIFIPQNVLTKKGKLTEEEVKILHSHIDYAMNVIGDMDFDYPVASTIHQMYERMDGSGYPNNLNGTNINLLSRILGACDVYCALIEPRVYRKQMTVTEAVAEIKKEEYKYDKGVLAVIEKTVHE